VNLFFYRSIIIVSIIILTSSVILGQTEVAHAGWMDSIKEKASSFKDDFQQKSQEIRSSAEQKANGKTMWACP